MIIIAKSMYFGIPGKTKSVAQAKTKLMRKFAVVKHGDNNYIKAPGEATSTGAYMFDFTLDNPVGITFKDLFEIYNSIPKNLMDEYKQVLKSIEEVNPDLDDDENVGEEGTVSDQKYWFLNMKKQEYEGFIEEYLNNIRKEAEEEREDVMKMIEEGENAKKDSK